MGKYSRSDVKKRAQEGVYNKLCGNCAKRWLDPPDVVPLRMLDLEIELTRCPKCEGRDTPENARDRPIF